MTGDRYNGKKGGLKGAQDRLKEIVETNSHEPAFHFPAAEFRNVAPASLNFLFITIDNRKA